MEWRDRFLDLIEGLFSVEHLTSSSGNSYGAGQSIEVTGILRSVIPTEDLAYYPEVFVDEWASLQLLDQEFGLEPLIEFELDDSGEILETVQFSLMEVEGRRTFLVHKTPGSGALLLVAFDVEAAAPLIQASLLALLAADAAFGEQRLRSKLPTCITNHRSDLLPDQMLKKGMELLAAAAGLLPADGIDDYFSRVYTDAS